MQVTPKAKVIILIILWTVIIISIPYIILMLDKTLRFINWISLNPNHTLVNQYRYTSDAILVSTL